MNLDRRTFLQGVGTAAVGALAGLKSAAAAEPAGALAPSTLGTPDTPEFWRAVRALYPLEATPVYLNTGGLGPASQPVLDAVASTMRQLQEHSETGHGHFEKVRETLARYLQVQADEVCFTRNATEGNCIVAAGLPLRAGDEVIIESHAHPGGSFPWFNQAKQRGVIVKVFEPDNVTAEGNLERIRALVTPRTRVIQVSHVLCTTGLIMPVRAIADFAQARKIWFHIDGAQAAGMFPLALAQTGCDSYAFSGHKWVGGPHETGVFFLRRDRLDEIAPTGIGSYSGELNRLPGEIRYLDAASRHEYGTRNAGLALGLMAAVDLQEKIGRERIAQHGATLATHVNDGLKGVCDITVLTPADPALRGSMITFRHARVGAHELFGYLQKQHGLRCRPVTEQDLGAVRVSFHVFNSAVEADRLIAGVRESARAL